MDHLFDEFSKSLSRSVHRRESLRRVGALLAGALLSPLGLETAWAQGPNLCKSFCKCRNKQQQDQCLAACRACSGNTSRLGGSCGSYVCCSVAACKGVCSDLQHDPNCGACGNNCSVFGETCCGDYCADLDTDADNCGACGNVCPASAPFCTQGLCSNEECYGADLNWDSSNCGFCGNVCPWGTACVWGVCEGGGGF